MLLGEANIYSSNQKAFSSSWITTPFKENYILGVKTLALKSNDSLGFLDIIRNQCRAFAFCPPICDVCGPTRLLGSLITRCRRTMKLLRTARYHLMALLSKVWKSLWAQRRTHTHTHTHTQFWNIKDHSLYLGALGMVGKAGTCDEPPTSLSPASLSLSSRARLESPI